VWTTACWHLPAKPIRLNVQRDVKNLRLVEDFILSNLLQVQFEISIYLSVPKF